MVRSQTDGEQEAARWRGPRSRPPWREKCRTRPHARGNRTRARRCTSSACAPPILRTKLVVFVFGNRRSRARSRRLKRGRYAAQVFVATVPNDTRSAASATSNVKHPAVAAGCRLGCSPRPPTVATPTDDREPDALRRRGATRERPGSDGNTENTCALAGGPGTERPGCGGGAHHAGSGSRFDVDAVGWGRCCGNKQKCAEAQGLVRGGAK